MSNFRPSPQSTKKERGQDEQTCTIPADMKAVFKEIRALKIKGNKKRLIKIDDNYEDLLKVFNPVFSVDVTKLMNFLLGKFFDEHPEIVGEIKKSQKNLKHELD